MTAPEQVCRLDADALAGPDAPDFRAHFDDDARQLVPAPVDGPERLAPRVSPTIVVKVRAADAGRADADEHLVGGGRRRGHVFDPNLSSLVEDR
jgi:hypothetical protein